MESQAKAQVVFKMFSIELPPCAATAAAMEDAGISMVVKVPFSLGICTCRELGVEPSEMPAAAAAGCDC